MSQQEIQQPAKQIDQHNSAATNTQPDPILEHLPEAILVLNPAGNITRVLGSADALLGLSINQLKTHGLKLIDMPACSFTQLCERARSEKRAFILRDVSYTAAHLQSEAQIFDVHVKYLPLADEAGQNPHSNLNPNMRDDIAIVLFPRGGYAHKHVKPFTPQLVSLTQALAHEIRNPLASIKGAAQLASKALSEDKKHLSQIIEKEAGRIGSLLAQLEGMSLTPTSALESLNVHRIINRLITISKTWPHVPEIRCDYDPSLPRLMGDSDLILNILHNLLKNAVEAKADGLAHVTIRTRYRSGVYKQGSGRSVPLGIEVIVEDDGPGVSDALREHIFSPFVSQKEAGRGLGLALAALYMEHMGGEISLSSKPAQAGGASFTLSFVPSKLLSANT